MAVEHKGKRIRTGKAPEYFGKAGQRPTFGPSKKRILHS
jgi:hypothetical protein